MKFEIVGKIGSIEIIAVGKSIREYKRLTKFYGRPRWRKLKGISSIKLNDRIHLAELHWKHTGLAGRKSRSNGSSPKKRGSHYVVCVNNEAYPASLELRKIYSLVPDRAASKSGLLRVIDESGEDYLYPADYFVAIRLPRAVAKVVRLAS